MNLADVMFLGSCYWLMGFIRDRADTDREAWKAFGAVIFLILSLRWPIW